MKQRNTYRLSLASRIDSIRILIRSRLWAQILVALVAGITVGLILSPEGGAFLTAESSYRVADWLRLPGKVFLNLIQMVVIPLVTCSIIIGISSSGDPDYLKRVGLRIFPYFVATTIIAVTIGVLITLLIQPGKYIDSSMLLAVDTSDHQVNEATDFIARSLPDQLADLIPGNIEAARVDKDMLQIVIFAILLGVAVISIPKEKSAPVLGLLDAVQDIALRVVSWAMLLAPYAVFGLLADITIRVGIDAILGMSVYVGTVILGLVLLLLFYMLIVCLAARRSPLAFLTDIREVQLLAFSTSSSAAVMPLSMQTATEKLRVKPSISKFIVPLGATINMDGTALYQVVAALFLTQVYGIDLTISQIVLLTMTTVGASIGSPSTPGVGIVILATILNQIGVPASGIALIIGVDRILDMCRTAVNVSGDLTACVVMDRWLDERKQLDPGSGEAMG